MRYVGLRYAAALAVFIAGGFAVHAIGMAIHAPSPRFAVLLYVASVVGFHLAPEHYRWRAARACRDGSANIP